MTSRRVGERFTDLERGEILVVGRGGCDGCVYVSGRNDYSHSACNAPERLELTGSCLAQERHDGASVQFVKLNDYAVFKFTGGVAMNEDRPVGEIFEHPGHHEKLIVVKAYGCDFCARRACGCADELTGPCASNGRDDKKSVQFVPLRKHVEHKFLGDYDAAW